MIERLRIVTPARWLADEFSAAAPDDLIVLHDLGLVMPENIASTAWWCPMQYAARLLASGAPPRFTAPGPRFTAELPAGVLGRTVTACRLGDLRRAGTRWVARTVHAKIAEAKLATVPSQVYRNVGEFIETASNAAVSDNSIVQLSDTVDMDVEARCFVMDRRVVAASVYLDHGTAWDGLPGPGDTSWATGFATGVVASIRRQPRAYTLDVARLRDGRPVVVEANPAWSSNPYHCDLRVVTSAVLASQAGSPWSRWRWRPDPAIAARQYPLPRARAPLSWPAATNGQRTIHG